VVKISTGGTSPNSTEQTSEPLRGLRCNLQYREGDVLDESQTADLDLHSRTRAEVPCFHQTMPNDRRAVNANRQTGMTHWSRCHPSVVILISSPLKREQLPPSTSVSPPTRPDNVHCRHRTRCVRLLPFFLIVDTTDSALLSRIQFRVSLSASSPDRRSLTACIVLHRCRRHPPNV
jgi:hypothetical protein